MSNMGPCRKMQTNLEPWFVCHGSAMTVTFMVQSANRQKMIILPGQLSRNRACCRSHRAAIRVFACAGAERGEASAPLPGAAQSCTSSAKAFLPCSCQAAFARMSQGKESKCSLIIALLLFNSGVLLKGRKYRGQLISCS